MSKTIRALIGKVGLDNHDRGSKYMASVLQKAGMEVVYLPRFETTEALIQTAIDEDVDVVGLSFLSGEYRHYVPTICEALAKGGKKDVLMVVGGLIAKEDFETLKATGVHGIFLPGTTGDEVVQFINEQLPKIKGGI